MKKRIDFIIALGLLSSLCTFVQAQAARIDDFTFFVPWQADDLAEFFRSGGQQPSDFTVAGVETIISISVLDNDSLIYYDHWEDGFEPDTTCPIPGSTTHVWGDDNPDNGAPPGFDRDVLNAADVIILRDVVPVDAGDQPVLCDDRLCYDGGDKIVSANGPIAVTLTAWPQPTGNILFADAWEIYPTSRWSTEYTIPVGENLNTSRGGFTVVSLNVQALEDGTVVDIDDPISGFQDTVTLNEGQQYSVVDGVSAGTRVEASKAVQVHIFAKDPDGVYEARGYTMLPRNEWGSVYLAARSSDGDFWLYNPHDIDLEVSVQTIAGTTSITIPGGSAGRYPPLPDPLLSTASGVRFASPDGRVFYGIAALDADQVQDWGYALLPIDYLTTQTLIGWAPGNNCNPPGICQGGTGFESRVYVTAVTTTTVNVDYGVGRMASFEVSPLEEQAIADPVDFDMTGAFLRSNDCVPFMAVWGQNQDAPDALPSIDVGSNIAPLRAPSIQKVSRQPYCCIPQNAGIWPYAVAFTLRAKNAAPYDFEDVVIADTLSSELTYLAGSATLDGISIPDDSDGSPFPLDEGGYNIGTVPGSGHKIIAFEVTTSMTGTFENQVAFVGYEAECDSPPAASANIDVLVQDLGFKVDVTGPSDAVQPGQVITFDVALANTGQITITKLPLWETFDENFLTFRSASPPPDVTATHAITWTDLTESWGYLPPKASANLAVSFTVNNPLPTDVYSTTSVFGSEWMGDSPGGTERDACICDSVDVWGLPSPTPTPTPTSDNGDGDGGGPTPTPWRTPTPGGPGVGGPTITPWATWTPIPTPAVVLLPETGDGNTPGTLWWLWLALPLLGLPAAWLIRCRRG